VVVVVSQSHYLMLHRNLVYTALTRAKQPAVIVVNGRLSNRQTGAIYRSALVVAVANDRIARRCSGLAEQLVSAIEARRLNPATETSITTAIADSELAPTSCLLTGVRAEVSCTFARRFGIR
jgi:exodeoxyribonuclease V alpha subunit